MYAQEYCYYSLNPKFSTKYFKNFYTNYTLCFSYRELRPQTPYQGFAPELTGGLPPPRPFGSVPFLKIPGYTPCEPIHCKILGTPMTYPGHGCCYSLSSFTASLSVRHIFPVCDATKFYAGCCFGCGIWRIHPSSSLVFPRVS